MYRYFKRFSGIGTGNHIYFWKSKRLSNENITAPTISDYSLNSQLSYLGTKTRLEFKGSCLKHYKIVYDHDNICIVYEISKTFNSNSYSTLENVQLI